MATDVESAWEAAVDAGVIPVSGPYDHDDLFRALAFGVAAGGVQGTARHDAGIPHVDLVNYVHMRVARAESGQDVKNTILRRMETAMTPEQRAQAERMIETRTSR